MGKDNKFSIFQKLSREEKINRLKTDLKIFENSENSLHDLFILVSTKSNSLNDEILDEIYQTLLNLLEQINDKNLGKKLDSLKNLEKKLKNMKKNEKQDKDKDLEESEKLLEQL